jgi:hypothetical protein
MPKYANLWSSVEKASWIAGILSALIGVLALIAIWLQRVGSPS